MKSLKGTKTEKNLLEAFAGESMARNKYTFFASKAKKDGYVQIAKIFEETAANEKEHAKIWFKLLNGGIDDTAAEVRALRAQGIRVAAVFMGENASVPAANAIYGRDLARIRRIDQLAATAGRLIQDEIRELSS